MERSTLSFGLPQTYVMIALSVLLFLYALLGNLLVVAVILRYRYMRTTINYFILNLAVADLLCTIIIVPVTTVQNILNVLNARMKDRRRRILHHYYLMYTCGSKAYFLMDIFQTVWPMGWFLCKTNPYMQGMTVSASILTLTAVAFDRLVLLSPGKSSSFMVIRFLAICFPLGSYINKRIALIIIAGIWLVAASVFTPWLVGYRLTDEQGCAYSSNIIPFKEFYIYCVFILHYVIPLLMITAFYSAIGFTVWRSSLGKTTSFRQCLPRTSCFSCKKRKCADLCANLVGCCPANTNEADSHVVKTKPTRWNKHFEHARKRRTGQLANNLYDHDCQKENAKSKVILRKTNAASSRTTTLKVIKMLVTVVITFALLWLPFHVNINLYLHREFGAQAIPITRMIAWINYGITPCIYCIYSKQFRRTFGAFIFCRKSKRTNHYSIPPRMNMVELDAERKRGVTNRVAEVPATITEPMAAPTTV